MEAENHLPNLISFPSAANSNHSQLAFVAANSNATMAAPSANDPPFNWTMDDGFFDAHPIVFPQGATIFAAACCIFFIILGTLGNSVTVLALVRCAKLRAHATTAFVVSLTLADLLFCVLHLPLTATRFVARAWVLGDTLCTLFPFFFYANVGVSLLSMTAITINRYILIGHYHLYDRIYQRRNIIAMIAFIWVFSFAILIPPLANLWGQMGYSPETFSCTILKLNGTSPKKFLFLFGFLLPCLVIVLSYSCIFYKVRQSRQNVASHSPKSVNNGNETPAKAVNGVTSGNSNSSQWLEDLRLTRLMLIIFCSFIGCYLPLAVANVLLDDREQPTFHILASVLAYSSSCINPLIYAVLNRQYRTAYCRLLCWRRYAGAGSRSGTGRGHSGHSSQGSGSRSTNSGNKTVATDVYQYSVVANKVTRNGNGIHANGVELEDSSKIPLNK